MLAARPLPAAASPTRAWRRRGRPGARCGPSASSAVEELGRLVVRRVDDDDVERRRSARRRSQRRDVAGRRPGRRAPARCVRSRFGRDDPDRRRVALDEGGVRAAPRESASMPGRAAAREQVEDRAPGRSGSRIANSVCLTRSPIGRVPAPGPARRIPRARPAMTRPASAIGIGVVVAGRHPPRCGAASRVELVARARRRPSISAPRVVEQRLRVRPGADGELAMVVARRATRRAAAAGRSGRARGRRPRGAARSRARRARTRRAARRRP